MAQLWIVVVVFQSISCVQLFCDPMDCTPPASSVHGISQAKNTRVGCHFLLHGIFPTQGSNPCTCIDRWILHHWATRLGFWNTYTHTHTHIHTHTHTHEYYSVTKKEWNDLIYCFENAHLFTEIVTAGFLFAITCKYFLIISLKKEE